MSLFVHLMLIAAFVATPGGGSALSESIARTRVPFREVLFQGAAPKPASDWIAKLRGEGQAAPQQRGAAGGPRRAERPGRMAAAGTGRDAQLRGREAFARLFGAGVTAGALDGEGNQRDLLRALGGVRGRTIADADGTGGMAARGPGPGGGGPPEGTLTIGALDRPGADPGSRPGKVGLTKSSQEIELSVGPVTLIGGTDKALLRRAIEGYRPQIRYCYERALAQTPGLYGKFLVEWTITADGRVNAPRVLESTMSPEVDRCLLEKIGRWRLPPPIGGGVVVVRYPFLFRSAG
jgi:TonB family protein